MAACWRASIFFADDGLIASYDGAGTLLAPLDGSLGGDINVNGAAGNGTIFRATWTVPGVDKIVNLAVVSTTITGRSQVSALAAVHVTTDTTDQPPVVAISGITDGEQFPVNTGVNITVTATDPDAQSGTTVRPTLPAAIVSRVIYYVNTTRIGTALTGPYGFPFALDAAGSYVVNVIATDGAGLSSVATPILIQGVAPTVVHVRKTPNNHVLTTGQVTRVKVIRTGDLSGPLTVTYTTTGNAVSGIDFQPLSGTLFFPASGAVANIRIKGLNDGIANGTKKLKVILQADPNGAYTLKSPIKRNLLVVDPE